MKILFVHNFHQRVGGDDAVVQNYIEMLRRRGHTVELYSRHNDEVKNFGLFAKVRFLLDTIFSIKTWRDVRGIIRQFRPEIIFVHGIYPLISPSVYDAAWTCRTPVVQMVHDMRFWCPMAWFFRNGKICTLCAGGNFWRAIRHRCYRNSLLLSALYAASIFLMRKRGLVEKVSLFIIPSEHIRKYLLGSGVSAGRIALHPHIIAAPPQNSLSSKSAERYAAFLGRLSPEKGVMSLVHVAERLPHIRFKIAGTGPMDKTLRDYVKQRNLLNVSFYGFLSGEDKNRFLREAALLAVPSECYESFGQVVVEAYACGTPVVAANHGGVALLVKDGETGWLFRPGDEEHFFSVLQHAWDFPDLEKISQAALGYFETYLRENTLITDLEKSLTSAVNHKDT